MEKQGNTPIKIILCPNHLLLSVYIVDLTGVNYLDVLKRCPKLSSESGYDFCGEDLGFPESCY